MNPDAMNPEAATPEPEERAPEPERRWTPPIDPLPDCLRVPLVTEGLFEDLI